jgi:hypothetical protein
MPKDAGGVGEVRGLQRPCDHRSVRIFEPVTAGQIDGAKAIPPDLHIVDEHMHDEIPRVFGDVKVLQQKRVLPHVHLHEGGSNHFGAKSKIAIEALADFEILGRNKWAQCNDATSGVARIWHGNLVTLRRPTQNGGITGSSRVRSGQRGAHAVDDILHGKRGEQHAEQAGEHDITRHAEQPSDMRAE